MFCVRAWLVWVVGACVLDFGVNARLGCEVSCVLVVCFGCIVFRVGGIFGLVGVCCYS